MADYRPYGRSCDHSGMRITGMLLAALLLAGCGAAPEPQTTLDAALESAANTEFTLIDGPRQPFPQWQTTDLDGYDWTTANLAHRYVVVNFWASWCQPCVDEWPELQAAAAGHPSVQFVGVNSKDELAAARRFLAANHSEYRHLQDADAWLMQQLQGFPNTTLPTTIILDPDHGIAAWKVGPLRKGQLRRALAQLLAAEAVPAA